MIMMVMAVMDLLLVRATFINKLSNLVLLPAAIQAPVYLLVSALLTVVAAHLF